MATARDQYEQQKKLQQQQQQRAEQEYKQRMAQKQQIMQESQAAAQAQQAQAKQALAQKQQAAQQNKAANGISISGSVSSSSTNYNGGGSGSGSQAAYTRPETGAYNESQQVKDAYAAMQAAQQGQPGAYTPSQTVLDAQTALQNLQTTKPQGYTNKYQPQMEELLQQIMNPGKFNYEFNGDNLFKMYADEYTQRGKQASMDAMGQAAALTGGYGNSYAQLAGNQAYDQYLTQLYDRGLELRDRAYQQFTDDQNRLFEQYGLLNDAENTAYNRYRDTVGDWNNERGYLADMYNNERNIDYNLYRDLMNDWMANRDYSTNQYNQLSQQDYNRYADARDFAEQQYQYDTNLKENIRQFNESLDWDKMSTQQKYAADWAMQILANGQMPSEEMLRDAGLSAEDAQKLMAQIEEAVGGTGGRSGALVTEGAFNNYYETNPDGSLKKDKNGNLIPYDTSKGNYSVLSNPTNDVIGATTVAGTASKVGNNFNDLWKKIIKK